MPKRSKRVEAIDACPIKLYQVIPSIDEDEKTLIILKRMVNSVSTFCSAEYIPFFYFIPQSMLSHYGKTSYKKSSQKRRQKRKFFS